MTTENILLNYDKPIAELGLSLRKLLLKQLPNIQETPDVPANIIGYGYGPGYKDTICVIIPSKKGIKLGFYKGSELEDPEKLLTGTGKVHRFIEIKSTEDLKHPALKALLKKALNAYEKRKAN